MKKLFGFMKINKTPPPTLYEVSARLKKRAESKDEKIKHLDAELATYKEQITTTRPGPAQQFVKDRASEIMKEKRMCERERDMLYKQAFNLHEVAFKAESINERIKVAQQRDLPDEMSDMMEVCKEIQVEALGRNDSLPDDINEDLMGGRNVINRS